MTDLDFGDLDEGAIGDEIAIRGPGHLPMHEEMEVLTYSSLNAFRNCSRKFDLRYQEWLSGDRQAAALFLGGAFHDALDIYYSLKLEGADHESRLTAATTSILVRCEPVMGEPWGKGIYMQAVVMIEAYVKRWQNLSGCDVHGMITDSEYELLAVEQEFIAPITNPETGRASRTFKLAGAVDGVIRLKADGRLYIKETKTSGKLDGGYLEALWTDFQSMVYAHHLGKYVYKEQFAGVLYDVAAKVQRKQVIEETEAEMEERIARFEPKLKRKETEDDSVFASRCANYKTEASRQKHREAGPIQGESDDEYNARLQASKGKSAAKVRAKGPKPGEPDEDYMERLAGVYAEPERQNRSLILFDKDRLDVVEHEVWDLTKQIMASRGRKRFSMNTSQCYAWGRPCDFVPICRQGRLDDVTLSGLIQRRPHSELSVMDTTDDVSSSDDDDGVLAF